MFASIGDVIAAPDIARGKRGGRTGEPIRRHSYTKGRCEGTFWRRTDRQEVRRIVLSAHRYELVTRQPGARKGALGFVALEVLEYLANLVDFRTGRLDPSLDYLMGKLKRSKDAIVTALQALRAHGFLDWLRRYVPTGNEGRGPRVQQTSNAYRMALPARALRLLGRYARPAPAPDDFVHAQEARAAELEGYKAAMTNAEKARFLVEDDGLAGTLARLGAAMDARKERESAKRSESLSRFLS